MSYDNSFSRIGKLSKELNSMFQTVEISYDHRLFGAVEESMVKTDNILSYLVKDDLDFGRYEEVKVKTSSDLALSGFYKYGTVYKWIDIPFPPITLLLDSGLISLDSYISAHLCIRDLENLEFLTLSSKLPKLLQMLLRLLDNLKWMDKISHDMLVVMQILKGNGNFYEKVPHPIYFSIIEYDEKNKEVNLIFDIYNFSGSYDSDLDYDRLIDIMTKKNINLKKFYSSDGKAVYVDNKWFIPLSKTNDNEIDNYSINQFSKLSPVLKSSALIWYRNLKSLYDQIEPSIIEKQESHPELFV